MENSNGPTDDVSVSAKIPKSVILAVVAALIAGGVGLGARLPEKTEAKAFDQLYEEVLSARKSAERSEVVVHNIASVLQQHESGYAARVSRNENQIEILRNYISERTSLCYPLEEGRDAEKENTIIHEQIQRSLSSLEREVDGLQRTQR